MSRMLRGLMGNAAFVLVVVFFVVYSVSPFYWAVNTSLKPESELERVPTELLPEQPTLEHYSAVLDNELFVTSVFNSALVALSATAIALVIGGLAAYALGRFDFRGRRLMRYVILLMSLFPTVAVLPSLFSIITDLGLNGSQLSLILTYPMFTLPITTLPAITFFRGLPKDIEQAAYIDGANTFQLFTRILLPLSLPVLFASGLITFVGVWSEYLLALAFTSANPSSWTVTVAIKFLGARLNPPQLMAAAVLLSVPLVVIIALMQRRFLQNSTEGAVKG